MCAANAVEKPPCERPISRSFRLASNSEWVASVLGDSANSSDENRDHHGGGQSLAGHIAHYH